MLYDSHKPQNLDLPYDLYIPVKSIWPRLRIRNFKVENAGKHVITEKPEASNTFFDTVKNNL